MHISLKEGETQAGFHMEKSYAKACVFICFGVYIYVYYRGERGGIL